MQIGHLVQDEPCPIPNRQHREEPEHSQCSLPHLQVSSQLHMTHLVARLPYVKYFHVLSVKQLKISSWRKINHLSAQAHLGCFCLVQRQRGKTCSWFLSPFLCQCWSSLPSLTSPTTSTTKQGSFNFPNTDYNKVQGSLAHCFTANTTHQENIYSQVLP